MADVLEKSIISHMEQNVNNWYYPSETILQNANVPEYENMYHYSVKNREKFWAEQAEKLHWFKKWDKVLDSSNPPFYKWFVGGRTNIVYNALDRQQQTAVRNKSALIWEGEPGDL
jgi:acetyl-CoA synthetase